VSNKCEVVLVSIMKVYWASGRIDPLILNLQPRWNEWLAVCSERHTPEKRAPPFPLEWVGWATELILTLRRI